MKSAMNGVKAEPLESLPEGAEKVSAPQEDLTPQNPRTWARTYAVQTLYALSFTGGEQAGRQEAETAVANQLAGNPADGKPPKMDEELFRAIVVGTTEDRKALHRDLVASSGRTRPLDPLLEAAVLAGAWEVRNCPDTDLAVLIDEYLNLARRFGAGDGTKVLHAMLDGFGRTERKERTDDAENL